jgi:hypothetical protein
MKQPLLFPIMYQGYNKLDEREVNYFALSKAEALSYGSNIRAVMIELKKPLMDDDYYKMQNEFEDIDQDHKWGDILDNSEAGIKRQHRFFKFLEKKGYDGITKIHRGCVFYPSIDSQYAVVFNKKDFKVLSEDDLDSMAGWMIKQLNTHSTELQSRLMLHNLKAIYDNHNISDEMRGYVKEQLEQEGLLDGKIDVEFYYQRLNKSVVCCAKTLSGKECTRKTLNGNGLCWQHDN